MPNLRCTHCFLCGSMSTAGPASTGTYIRPFGAPAASDVSARSPNTGDCSQPQVPNPLVVAIRMHTYPAGTFFLCKKAPHAALLTPRSSVVIFWSFFTPSLLKQCSAGQGRKRIATEVVMMKCMDTDDARAQQFSCVAGLAVQKISLRRRCRPSYLLASQWSS